MLSSISSSVQTQITKPSTSLQLWISLDKLFGNQYLAKLMLLKFQLQSTKKEGLTMSSYFSKTKDITKNSSMVGSLVLEDDFILYILQGILFEYNSIVGSINSRSEPLGLKDLQTLLLSHKMQIQSTNTKTNPFVLIINC